MDAETRAALGRGIRALRLSRDHALFSCGCKKRAKKDRLAADALQALLDSEKGGDGPARVDSQCERDATDANHKQREEASGLPVAGAASTAPPDSLSKIAADLRDWLPVPNPVTTEVIRGWAARVEALGLEPGERETVKNQTIRLHEMLTWLKDQPGTQPVGWLEQIIAALTPIAERVEAREFKPDIESMEFEP